MSPPTFRTLSVTVIASCSLAFSLPAIAQDPASRFQEAQRLMRGGQLDAALTAIESLREEYPHDVDYAFARAQILGRTGRDDEALAELAAATELAPDYEDVWRLRYAIQSRQSGGSAQTELQDLRQQVAERFPEASWWQPPAHVSAWTLVAGAGHDSLTNGFPDWNHQFISVMHNRNRGNYTMRVSREQRNSGADLSLGLGAEHAWLSGWYAGAAISVADNPEYVPELGLSIHAGRPLGDGWVVDFGYRRRQYTTATVGSLVGIVEKYYGDFRFMYGLSLSHLNGASSFMSHTVTGNWYFGDASSIGITIGSGREAESLGNGLVLETDVHSVSLSGLARITDRVGLQWWLGTHEQGDIYRRRFLGMAVSIDL